MIRALIVDDEKKAREGLKLLLARDHDIIIVGECKDGLEAIAAIREQEPDIVFLDIQMPEVNGFDVLNSISYKIPAVIFTTAYDQYAVKAFELHAIDYLLKPFTEERFYKSLDFAKAYLIHKNNNALTYKIETVLKEYIIDHKLSDQNFFIHQTHTSRQNVNKFAVKVNGKILFINIADVRYIEALDAYVKIFIKDNFVLLKESMREMEKRLSQFGFIRIHRSCMINVYWLSEIEPYFNGDFFVRLTDGCKLKGSRKYRELLSRYK